MIDRQFFRVVGVGAKAAVQAQHICSAAIAHRKAPLSKAHAVELIDLLTAVYPAAVQTYNPPYGILLRAVNLNSGLYRLVRGEEDLLDSLAEAYFAGGGTDEEYDTIALAKRVTKAFPPTFVMTALGDFLVPQAMIFSYRSESRRSITATAIAKTN